MSCCGFFSAIAIALLACAGASAATSVQHDDITLELQPRVCTLAADDDTCDTTVRAQWRSPRNESLCLVIVDRPDIQRCWEDFSSGVYNVELSFNRDLTVELRDPQLQKVLVSETIAVIRQALELRRKRRQPWNLLY
ncbi:MAG TPA: DUF3019 domain-containing protein [Povalibacter sp.]|uniref:DUF3019 domain-containing protein n=1 Tax=Povalibacter sp. TaxID=1962978 RepID=UPI002BD02E78|nr:DUF3019 domain-containing protein [Povalibacter sp.]HMN44974.1 DUF3019 domain-containing protein [Povalibacter sp.]